MGRPICIGRRWPEGIETDNGFKAGGSGGYKVPPFEKQWGGTDYAPLRR